MATKRIWVIEGMGNDNPIKYELEEGTSVAEFKNQFAKKFNVSASNVEVATDTRRLTNQDADMYDLVTKGETVYIIPRTRAGGY